MRMLASILLVTSSMVAMAQPVDAQTHTASLSALDAAVQEHVAASTADREAVLRLLERPEIQAIAGDIGLDLRRAQGAIATLEGSQLADLAAQARQVERTLAGGQSKITISTTAIIIGLLVLILIIVAV